MKCFAFLFILVIGLPVFAGDEADRTAIDHCLHSWGKHPFGKTPDYRTIAGHVRIIGIGGSEVEDVRGTSKPELVLVKPNVAVMSKATMKLMNPKGWYCLKGRVAVMGKTEIDVACKTKLASSDDGTTVLGGGEQNGVTVLGSSRIVRDGCIQ